MKQGRKSDAALLVLDQLIWGAGWSAIKLAQEQMGPVTLNVWTLGISVVTLLPFLMREKPLPSGPRPAARWDYFMAGVVGLAGMTLLYAAGAAKSLAANGALISMAVPVLTSAIAVVVLAEQISWYRFGSLVLALAGVAIVSASQWGDVRLFGPQLFGNALLFAGTACNAIYVVYSKKLLAWSTPLRVLFWTQLLGLAGSLPFLYLEPRAAVSRYTPATWACLFFLGVVYFTLTMVVFFRILERLDAGQIMVSTYLQPVFGVLTAAITLGEKVTVPMAAGGAVVLAATLLATLEKPKVKPSEPSLRTAQ